MGFSVYAVKISKAVSAHSDRPDYNSLSVPVKTFPLTVYLKYLSQSIGLECDPPVWHEHMV